MKLLLVRHGLTQWNVERRIQGHTDIELCDDGREQIRSWQLPSWCRQARCYSSPLRRAVETAELLGLRPGIAPALTEMSWGQWEGRRLVELRSTLGQSMRDNEARGVDFRPPAGESPRDVQRRAMRWLGDVGDESVVAVTHKGVINALYAAACCWDMRSTPPDKLRWHCAQEFDVIAGRITVSALNVPLNDDT